MLSLEPENLASRLRLADLLAKQEKNQEALKELRASLLRGDHGWNTLPVTSNGSYYFVYLRDTLPFEDANVFVPFSASVEPY